MNTYRIELTNNRNVKTLHAPTAESRNACLPDFDDLEFASEFDAVNALVDKLEPWMYEDAENHPLVTTVDTDQDGGMDLYQQRIDELVEQTRKSVLRHLCYEYDGVHYSIVRCAE